MVRLKEKRQIPRGHLRLLWELSAQGYKILFEHIATGNVRCDIQKKSMKVSAESNNVSSALYVAYSKLRALRREEIENQTIWI